MTEFALKANIHAFATLKALDPFHEFFQNR